MGDHSAFGDLMRNILVAAILSSCIPAWADQPVTFASRDNGFALISAASGHVTMDGPMMAVTLTKHSMRANKDYKTPTKVVEYRVGLARANAQGRWEVERWSAPIPAVYTLSSGETREVPGAKALILTDHLRSLRDTWLVLQVAVQRDGVDGTTYAHSQKLALD
jgi:hypothetical protein